jgi:RNA polymerase sigma-70 factor (ECF subfamily)
MHTNERETENLCTLLESAINQNSKKWLKYILAVLRNEADAEDVMQEAIKRVLSRDRLFPSEEEIRKYLSRAISNSALELYNRKKRERNRHMPLCEPLLHSNGLSPHKYLEESEISQLKEQMIRLLDDGLLQLPEKEHEALRLTMLESQGLSIRDAGLNNRIAYSTLRHRSKQAIRHLRKYFERELKEHKPAFRSRKSLWKD